MPTATEQRVEISPFYFTLILIGVYIVYKILGLYFMLIIILRTLNIKTRNIISLFIQGGAITCSSILLHTANSLPYGVYCFS